MRASRIPYWYLLLCPMLSYGFGYFLNALVMAVNSNQMPVLLPGGCFPADMTNDFIHTCMIGSSHLKFLADWMYVRSIGPVGAVVSPGDLFEFAAEKTFVPAVFAWVALAIRDLKDVYR